MNLYAAICHELLGHAAHLFSSNNITFLTQALHYLVDADAALPAPVPLPRLPLVEDDSRPPTPTSPGESQNSIHGLSSLHSQDSLDGLDNLDSPEFIDGPGIVFSTERESLVDRIVRMIDSALLDLNDDPFFSDEETDYQQPFARALLELSSSPRIQPLEIQTTLTSSWAPGITDDPTKRELLMPRPLRISKVIKLKTSPTQVPGKLTPDSGPVNMPGRYRPPRLPLKVIPTNGQNRDLSIVTPNRATSPMPVLPHPLPALPGSKPTTDPVKEPQIPPYLEDIDPVSAARIMQSNRGIMLLHEIISTGITEIHRQIDQVTEIQRARRARKIQRVASFWSFHPVQSDESTGPPEPEPTVDEFGNILVKENRSQRIARLRAEDWNTVGLRSPRSTWKGARYYQELCAMVLNELHLDG